MKSQDLITFLKKNLYNAKAKYSLINENKINVENFGYNIKTKKNKKNNWK